MPWDCLCRKAGEITAGFSWDESENKTSRLIPFDTMLQLVVTNNSFTHHSTGYFATSMYFRCYEQKGGLNASSNLLSVLHKLVTVRQRDSVSEPADYVQEMRGRFEVSKPVGGSVLSPLLLTVATQEGEVTFEE